MKNIKVIALIAAALSFAFVMYEVKQRRTYIACEGYVHEFGNTVKVRCNDGRILTYTSSRYSVKRTCTKADSTPC